MASGMAYSPLGETIYVNATAGFNHTTITRNFESHKGSVMNTIVTTMRVDDNTTDVFYLGVFIGRIFEPISGKSSAQSKWIETRQFIWPEHAVKYIIDTHKANKHRV